MNDRHYHGRHHRQRSGWYVVRGWLFLAGLVLLSAAILGIVCFGAVWVYRGVI